MDILIHPKKELIYFSQTYTEKRKIGLYINLENKIIEPKLDKNYKDEFWKVIKTGETQKLMENDIFRIGEIKFKILQINTKKINKLKLLKKEKDEEFKEILLNNINCRICLEGLIKKNPFLELCICCKKMPVHILCLQKWLKIKCLKKKNIFTYEFDKEKLCCDLCQKKYPASISFKNEKYELFKPEKKMKLQNYILLKKFNFHNKNLGYYLLYFSQQKFIFSIGSSKNNDICLNDNFSVSRQHSDIIIKNDNIFLKDNFSKYGTLILFNKPLVGSEINSLILQYNKMIFDFHIFKGKKCENCYNNFMYYPSKIEFLKEETIFEIIEKKDLLRMKTDNTIKKNKKKDLIKSKSKNFFPNLMKREISQNLNLKIFSKKNNLKKNKSKNIFRTYRIENRKKKKFYQNSLTNKERNNLLENLKNKKEKKLDSLVNIINSDIKKSPFLKKKNNRNYFSTKNFKNKSRNLFK